MLHLAEVCRFCRNRKVWSHDATGKGLFRTDGIFQQHRYHFAVEIRPGRFAVEAKKDFGAVAVAFVDVSHSQISILQIVRLVWEVGKMLETFVRRT